MLFCPPVRINSSLAETIQILSVTERICLPRFSASRFELSVVRRESLSIKGPVRLRIHHLL